MIHEFFIAETDILFVPLFGGSLRAWLEHMQGICKHEAATRPCARTVLVCCTALVTNGLSTQGILKESAPNDLTHFLLCRFEDGAFHPWPLCVRPCYRRPFIHLLVIDGQAPLYVPQQRRVKSDDCGGRRGRSATSARNLASRHCQYAEAVPDHAARAPAHLQVRSHAMRSTRHALQLTQIHCGQSCSKQPASVSLQCTHLVPCCPDCCPTLLRPACSTPGQRSDYCHAVAALQFLHPAGAYPSWLAVCIQAYIAQLTCASTLSRQGTGAIGNSGPLPCLTPAFSPSLLNPTHYPSSSTLLKLIGGWQYGANAHICTFQG